MSSNLPFDPRGYIKFLMENHMKNTTPTAKIGGGAGGFANAKPINVKAISGGGGSNIIDDLFKKGVNLGEIGESIGGGANASRIINALKAPLTGKGGMIGALGAGAMMAYPQMMGMKDYATGFKNYYRPEMDSEWNKRQLGIYTKNFAGENPSLLAPKIVNALSGNKATPQAKPLAKANIKATGEKPQALPALPNVAPSGSYPSYEQILKDAGVPIMDNFTPNSSQANQYMQGANPASTQQVAQSLAEKLGFGKYVQPDVAMTTPLATDRLNQIREYLGKYTPESYRQIVDSDASNTMRNQTFANTFKNPALGNIPTEQERQAKVLEYLQNGYNTDMGLTNTARKLAEADAMSKATGLPSTMFEDPKDVLANIVRPQITAQGQIDLSKQQGANAYQVAQLNNVLKAYGINTLATSKKEQLANAVKIAEIMGQSKIPPAMLGAMGFGVDPAEMMQILNMGNGSNYVMPDVGNASESY